MRYLNLRERDTVGVGQGHPLSEREADGIARLADRLPKGSLAWEHRALRFGPFCGVLRTSDLTIELLPKIERGATTSARIAGPAGRHVGVNGSPGVQANWRRRSRPSGLPSPGYLYSGFL